MSHVAFQEIMKRWPPLYGYSTPIFPKKIVATQTQKHFKAGSLGCPNLKGEGVNIQRVKILSQNAMLIPNKMTNMSNPIDNG
jgi:hypothetical protein